jgi:CAAX prenyl protease-like protein
MGNSSGAGRQRGASRDPGDAGIWPYALPYLAFGVVLALRDEIGAGAGGALAVAQVALPAALLAFFAARGAFPELARFRPSAGEALADVALGLAIAALWMGPYLWIEALPRPGPEAAFDPDALGGRAVTLALRFAGFALVTPFMEELFVRSFLLRYLDVVFDADADFREIPIGRFAWLGFCGTVVWFTVTHQPWEWIVAAPTGIALNLWLYRRRHLGSVVLSHAVANATIFGWVVLRAGTHPDLWIFL